MMRRAWALAAAGVLAGMANAQTPSTSKTTSPQAGVMTLKTAGQKDRTVRVIKSTKSADGRVVTEVKDVATGETLLVSDKAIGGRTDMAVTTTPMVPPVKSMAAKDGTATTSPKAKTRDVDPLLTGGSKSAAAMTASKTPATTKAMPVAKPVKETMPSAIAPKAVTMPVAQTPALLPAGTATRGGDALHVVLPVGYVPAEFRMKEETAPTVATLQQAARPTIRQDAATALAEGRYANRPEIQAILAGAAMHDPAPVVRAHCVTCLSKLGYAEPTYVSFLRQGTVDADPTMKAAVAEALAKLEPRK